MCLGVKRHTDALNTDKVYKVNKRLPAADNTLKNIKINVSSWKSPIKLLLYCVYEHLNINSKCLLPYTKVLLATNVTKSGGN